MIVDGIKVGDLIYDSFYHCYMIVTKITDHAIECYITRVHTNNDIDLRSTRRYGHSQFNAAYTDNYFVMQQRI